jgi:large subunit ribosomal protein L7/L12
MSTDEFVDLIGNMTVFDLAEKIKALEEKFGVSAAAPVAVAAAGPAGGGGAAEVEAQTEFDVILDSPGEKKIQVLKVVRELTGLGLKEAKELVDNPPRPVKEKVKKEEADAIKAKLEAEGAKISIK